MCYLDQMLAAFPDAKVVLNHADPGVCRVRAGRLRDTISVPCGVRFCSPRLRARRA